MHMTASVSTHAKSCFGNSFRGLAVPFGTALMPWSNPSWIATSSSTIALQRRTEASRFFDRSCVSKRVGSRDDRKKTHAHTYRREHIRQEKEKYKRKNGARVVSGFSGSRRQKPLHHGTDREIKNSKTTDSMTALLLRISRPLPSLRSTNTRSPRGLVRLVHNDDKRSLPCTMLRADSMVDWPKPFSLQKKLAVYEPGHFLSQEGVSPCQRGSNSLPFSFSIFVHHPKLLHQPSPRNLGSLLPL